jgi:ABC-type phosphate transport system ATPase subunit
MGRNQNPKLGRASSLASYFSKDQVKAVQTVLNSKDTVTGMIGDAGAGKTTVMPEIVRGIEAVPSRSCSPESKLRKRLSASLSEK